MLYLTGIWNTKTEANRLYYLFETRSESLIIGKKNFVIELLEKHKFEAKNFRIWSNDIEINQWPNGIRINSANNKESKLEYVLLTAINEQRFELVNSSNNVVYCGAAELKYNVSKSKIANCCVVSEHGIANYKSVDTYSINTKPKFKKYIDAKYKEFRAMAQMVGLDIRFDYEIGNEDVKLTHYTGTSKNVIIPPFITTVVKQAFRAKGIEKLHLMEGLQYIGQEAFISNYLTDVVIPESAKFIGDRAFVANQGGLSTGKYGEGALRILGDSTLMINNTFK